MNSFLKTALKIQKYSLNKSNIIKNINKEINHGNNNKINNISHYNFSSLQFKRIDSNKNSNNNKNSLYKNQHCNYFDKKKNTFVLNKKYFVNGMYPIIKENIISKNSPYIKTAFYYSIAAFFGYKTISKFLSFQFVRGILYSGLLICSVIFLRNDRLIDDCYLYGMNLLLDGKRVELVFNNHKEIIDISNIRTLNMQEKTEFVNHFREDIENSNVYPICINDHVVLISLSKKSNIYDREAFNFIKEGQYIEVIDDSEDDEINNDNIIDINTNTKI